MDQETKYWECLLCEKMMHEDKQQWAEFVGHCSLKCVKTHSIVTQAAIKKLEAKFREGRFWANFHRKKKAKAKKEQEAQAEKPYF